MGETPSPIVFYFHAWPLPLTPTQLCHLFEVFTGDVRRAFGYQEWDLPEEDAEEDEALLKGNKGG